MNNAELLVILKRIHERHEVTDDDVQAGRILDLVNEGLVEPNSHRVARYGCVLTSDGLSKLTELKTVAKWREGLDGKGWRKTAL